MFIGNYLDGQTDGSEADGEGGPPCGREEVNIDWFEILKLLCKISPAEF